jgi:glycyl-tRNA synthetase beta chain
MSDFLLELASEEIPARMQAAAVEQLRVRFIDGCKAAGLAQGDVTADATPRRLWLIARDVAPASAATREERKGPSASAPEAAIAGFLRGVGMARDQLEARETPKGIVLFAHIETPGRDAAAILADLVPAIVRDFQWPKSMRWGAASAQPGSPRWVRPLTGIVALLGGAVVACAAHGVAAGRVTRGHRIHAPGEIDIAGADLYLAQLRGAHVIASSAERRAIIAEGALLAAASKGLTVIEDAALVAENAGLTEWPVPLAGSFDPAFLAVPREVIQLTMRTNQKYFACADAAGALAPAFVCVANLAATDGGAAIVAGNERVLSARLSDAKFFWDQDVAEVREHGFARFEKKLETIVFHEKLGTVADKVDRVAKLARWLVLNAITSPLAGEVGLAPLREPGEGVSGDHTPSPRSAAPSRPLPQGEREALATLAEQAARVCKADLVSATVGEFPEVQGIAGAYLARIAGLDPQVADAIRKHYMADTLARPWEVSEVALALADRLDTLNSFFSIDEQPTGSRDPFALRRAAIQVVSLIFRPDGVGDFAEIVRQDVLDFIVERWMFQNKAAGGRPDLIAAARVDPSDGDLFKLGTKMRALEAMLCTNDGTNLLAGVKRAANILRIEEGKDGVVFDGVTDAALFAEPAESALATALDTAVPTIAAAVEREDFTAAMAALAALRPAVDAFFNAVIVNAPDAAIRANRLGLLARLRSAANSVADFSKVEG